MPQYTNWHPNAQPTQPSLFSETISLSLENPPPPNSPNKRLASHLSLFTHGTKVSLTCIRTHRENHTVQQPASQPASVQMRRGFTGE